MTRLSVLLALAFVWVGCKSDSPTPPSASAPSNPAAIGAVPAPGPVKPPAAPEPGVTEAAAQALVSAWVSAQNAQDFGAYEQLYAARFTGIKRAGDKTTRFDREGWLKDRRGMFERGFRVEADQVAIRTLGASAVVSLDQAFRSQAFSDRGPKQLVLTVEGGKAKIAREELLRSELSPRLSSLTLSDPEFAFVRTIAERRFWISRISPEGQTVSADPEFIENGAAFAPVASDRLPPSLRELAGSTVVLHPSADAACEVELNRWVVVAEFVPHFGDNRRWGGLDDEPAPPPKQIAREIFGPNQVSGRDHKYAVDVTAAVAGCPNARWARAKSLPPVAAYEVEELSGAELEALREPIRKTPAYAQLQAGFREHHPEGFWDQVQSANLTGYGCRVGSTRFVLGALFYAGECTDFSGELTALWRQQGKTLRPLKSNVGVEWRPELAIDLDGDGIPEWLSETELLGWDGKRYSIVASVKPANYDCPC